MARPQPNPEELSSSAGKLGDLKSALSDYVVGSLNNRVQGIENIIQTTIAPVKKQLRKRTNQITKAVLPLAQIISSQPQPDSEPPAPAVPPQPEVPPHLPPIPPPGPGLECENIYCKVTLTDHKSGAIICSEIADGAPSNPPPGWTYTNFKGSNNPATCTLVCNRDLQKFLDAWPNFEVSNSCGPGNPPPPPPPPPPPNCPPQTCPPICPPCSPTDPPSCGLVTPATDVSQVVNAGLITAPTEAWLQPGEPPFHLGGKARIFVGQKPANPGVQLLAGPGAAWDVMRQLATAQPLNGNAPIYIPGGPAVPPDQQCPPNPPDCEPGDKKPPDKSDTCNPFDGGDLPLISWSGEDCDDDITTWATTFGQIGNEIRTALCDNSDIFTKGLKLLDAIAKLPIVGDLLKAALGPFPDLLETVCRSIKTVCTDGVLSNTNFDGEYFDLVFCKAALSSIEALTVGVELPLRVTTEFHVEFTGLREMLDACIRRHTLIELPPLGEAIDLRRRDFIGDQSFQCICQMHGYQDEWSGYLLQAEREQLTADEYVRYSWRINDQADWLGGKIRGLGFINDDEIDAFKQSRVEPPSPAELLSFSRREVFRPGKLGVEYMLQEFQGEAGLREMFWIGGIQPVNFQIQDWSNLDSPEDLPDGLPAIFSDNGQGNFTFDAPLAFWLEHYTEISQSQGAEGLHRLRPNRVERFKSYVPGRTVDEMQKLIPFADIQPWPEGNGVQITPKPWTSYEQAKLLRQLEYNPVERGLLEAISYRVLGRIDLRRIYFAGGFGTVRGRKGFRRDANGIPEPTEPAEIEVAERFQDQGYTREDSRLQAYNVAYQYEIQYSGDPIKNQLASICDGVVVGVIDANDAIDRAAELLGSRDLAQTAVSKCILKMRVADIKQATSAVRKLFMRGEADEQEADSMLQNIGMVPDRIVQTLQIWRVERASQAKQATAEKLCQWHGKGLITTEEMASRLSRLGWKDEDISRIMKYCIMGELAASQKELEKRLKAEAAAAEKLQRERDRIAKTLQSQTEKRFKQLTKLETEKNVAAWWKDGIINADTVALIWARFGAAQEDIIRWMEHNAPPPPTK